jgi:hypothetical protein
MKLELEDILLLAENQKTWFEGDMHWRCPIYDDELEALRSFVTFVGNSVLEVYKYSAESIKGDGRDTWLTEVTVWRPQGINFEYGEYGRVPVQKMVLGSYQYDPDAKEPEIRVKELYESFYDPTVDIDCDPDFMKKNPHAGSRRNEIIGVVTSRDFKKEIERIEREEIFRLRGIGKELSKEYRY